VQLDLLSNLFSDTELCVRCGLCLPHCPTYGKTLDESESPRGRLSLIQAWAAGQLEASPKLLGHVDNCLLCRSCESACPANVPYGRLVDDFRAATADKVVKPLSARMKSAAVGYALQSPRLQRWSGPVRGVLVKTGLIEAVGFGELSAGLPAPFEHGRWQGIHPALGEEKAKVALFLGCTAELADAETVSAAIRLLNRLGVSVSIPARQGCCGGMALHNGEGEGFARMRLNNVEAFKTTEADAILSLASGCGAVLKEYEAQGFAAKIKDISGYIAEHPWPESVRLEPLKATVLVHSPCSLKNVLKSDHHPPALLRRIPGLRVGLFDHTPNCCGAAGTYLLNHPDMAQALRDDILESIRACPPNYVATSNVGCAMHLRAGLKQRGMGHVEVLHPLVLLDRQVAFTLRHDVL
jgi:glycolate oxidase iron-sulfur subunit